MSVPRGAIRFSHVTKQYHIMQRATPRLGAWLLAKAFEYFRREPFEALTDVSLEIQPGEMVGLLGHNGAGKSTALKLIAGISHPTTGHVEVNGKVASLLELGVGFHEELTGMENIFYSGAMLGLSRQQVLEKLQDIINFSGLRDFIYEPVKHYSSGMYSRLACAVALHLDPDIILVDEILAVGDAEFQQRGIVRMLEMHASGVTVVLVTHETATARDLCDRLIWIERGRVVEDGAPRGIHNRYLRSMMTRTLVDSPFTRAVEPTSADGPRIDAARFMVEGNESQEIITDQPARLEVDVVGSGDACVGLLWRWTDGRILAEDFTSPITFDAARTLIYDIPRWPLIRSQVSATLVLCDAQHQRIFHRLENAAQISVETPDFPELDVLVRPRVTWSLRPI